MAAPLLEGSLVNRRQRSKLPVPCEATPRGIEPLFRLGLGLFATLSSMALPAWAAGGSHSVDDAVLLEPGQCQIETWFERATGGARSLAHVGPACRVGEVELGLNVDREHRAGTSSSTTFGPQVKWALALNDDWSAGIVWSATGRNRSPRYLGGTVVLPVTWRASEAVLAHLNVGRDIRHGDRDTHRGGLALEWAPLEACSFVTERFRESGGNYWRASARWALTSTASIDLGRAAALGGSAPSWWTVGVNWAFAQ